MIRLYVNVMLFLSIFLTIYLFILGDERDKPQTA